MKIKLFFLARMIYVFSVLLFLVAFLVEKDVENLILWVSVIGMALSLILGIKQTTSVSSKVMYLMFLCWMLSRLLKSEDYTLVSIVLSGITVVLAIGILLNSIIYINKYCRKDIEKTLNDIEESTQLE